MRVFHLILWSAIAALNGCKSTDSGSTVSAAQPDSPAPAERSAAASEPEAPAQELIVAKGTFPANHASTLVELSPNHFMACWFAGSKEAAKDVQIYCSDKEGDANWTTPRIVVKRQESSRGVTNKFVGNPVLFKDLQDRVWLFYEAVKAFGHSAAVVDYKTSTDGGKTFSAGQAFAGSVTNFGHLPRNKPLQLSSGRIMVPLYKELTSTAGYAVMFTPQEGQAKDQKIFKISGEGHLQPSLTMHESSDGLNSVFAYLRNKKNGNVLMSEFDFIDGKFSPVKATNLPNPNAAVDAVTTEDNQILIAFNDSKTTRSPLSLAISENGTDFKKIYDFEKEPGEYSYPCLIKAQDGSYHLTYTFNRQAIKHVRFDGNWLNAQLVKAYKP